MTKTTTTSLTEKQFNKAIVELQDGLRIKKEYTLTQNQHAVYYKHLKDLTNEQIMKAVKVIIQTDEIAYFPPVARIRAAAGIDVAPPPKALTKQDIDNLWDQRISDERY